MLWLGSAAFFTFGIVLTLLGATQAEIARALALDLAASGFLGAVLALGIGGGVLLAGPLVDRFPRAPLMIGSCLFCALGFFAIAPERSYLEVVAALIAIGLGCGVYDTLVNAVVLERAGDRGASQLALVHASATLGAAVGPLLVRFGLAHLDWAQVFHAVGAVHVALAIAALTLRGSRPGVSRVQTSPNVAQGLRSLAPVAPALAALGVATFAYVGLENGVTLYAMPWAEHLREPERVGQWSISTFWGGLLIGRLWLVARRRESGLRLLAACGVAGAFVVCAGSLFARAPLALVTLFAGIALGPVYPLAITLVAKRAPSAAATALGLVSATAACGGFAIPWLAGAVGDALGVQAAIRLLGLHGFVFAAVALGLAKYEAGKLAQADAARHGISGV